MCSKASSYEDISNPENILRFGTAILWTVTECPGAPIIGSLRRRAESSVIPDGNRPRSNSLYLSTASSKPANHGSTDGWSPSDSLRLFSCSYTIGSFSISATWASGLVLPSSSNRVAIERSPQWPGRPCSSRRIIRASRGGDLTRFHMSTVLTLG